MRLRLAPLLLCSALATHAACKEDAPAPAPLPSASADDLAEGSEIVAAVTKASFRQGTLVRMGDRDVTFEYGRPGDDGMKPQQTVPRQMVWRLDGGPEPPLGSFAICRVAMTQRENALPSWYPCQVKSAAAGKLRILDHYGREHELDRSSVVAPSDEVQKNIESYLAEENRHRSFDRAFEEAGRPPRPEGWDPQPGEAVVIHFVGTSWYGGKVVENKRDKGKVRVSYDGGTWDDRDVPLGEIAPMSLAGEPDGPPVSPSAASTALSPGMFVITKPHTQTRRWEHNKVVSLSGAEVEVENRDAQRRTVKTSDVIPVVKP